MRETLTPFPYDPADETSIQQFARFVQYAEQAVETPLPAAVPRLELLYRLHYATDGVVGNLMNLLRYAALMARQQDQAVLALPTLAAAFDKRLAKHLTGKVNPFDLPVTEQFSAPLIPATRALVQRADSSRPGQRHGPAVSQLLRAS